MNEGFGLRLLIKSILAGTWYFGRLTRVLRCTTEGELLLDDSTNLTYLGE